MKSGAFVFVGNENRWWLQEEKFSVSLYTWAALLPLIPLPADGLISSLKLYDKGFSSSREHLGDTLELPIANSLYIQVRLVLVAPSLPNTKPRQKLTTEWSFSRRWPTCRRWEAPIDWL